MGFFDCICDWSVPSCWSWLRPQQGRFVTLQETRRKKVFENHLDIKRNVQTSRIIKHASFEKDYTLGAVIGTGLSGTVRMATNMHSGVNVAVKQLRTSGMSKSRIRSLLQEVEIYLLLDHPNICRLLAVYDERHTVYLVMELCTGKELYERLMSSVRYSESDAADVVRQIISAVRYCHAQNICHRDLKLENFVYQDQTKTKQSRLKMIDFGLSKVFSPGIPMTALTGTVYYVSPEVMRGSYNNMCDLWSVGVITYMLLTGHPPFSGPNDKSILDKIGRGSWNMRGPLWKNITDNAKDFIASLLITDPAARMKADEAMLHPWLLHKGSAKLEELTGVLDCMRRFSRESAMKRAVLAVLAHEVSADDIEDLTAHFEQIDKNGDGTVTLEELTEVMREHLTLDDSESAQMFERLDSTGDQTIHYSEFLAACMSAKFMLKEQHVYRLFQRFDCDGKGHITLQNLKNVLGDSFNGIEMQEVLQTCDEDGNGLIDYDEFLKCILGEAEGIGTGGNDAARMISKLCQAVDEELLRQYSRKHLGRSSTVCELTPAINTMQRMRNTKRYNDKFSRSTLVQSRSPLDELDNKFPSAGSRLAPNRLRWGIARTSA